MNGRDFNTIRVYTRILQPNQRSCGDLFVHENQLQYQEDQSQQEPQGRTRQSDSRKAINWSIAMKGLSSNHVDHLCFVIQYIQWTISSDETQFGGSSMAFTSKGTLAEAARKSVFGFFYIGQEIQFNQILRVLYRKRIRSGSQCPEPPHQAIWTVDWCASQIRTAGCTWWARKMN